MTYTLSRTESIPRPREHSVRTPQLFARRNASLCATTLRACVRRWLLGSIAAGLSASILAQSSSAVDADEWIYTIRRGENLWILNERYLIGYAHVSELQRLNRVADPYRIAPGTRIRMPFVWTRSKPGTARVAAMIGTVRIARQGQAEQQIATPVQPLRDGDLIMTSSGANAMLELSDGSRIAVLSDSVLRLEKLLDYPNGIARAWLDLLEGRTESKVVPRNDTASRFHIKTPAGITSVRGTQLRVSVPVQRPSSMTEVLVGVVSVANAGREIAVSEGFGTVVHAGEPPHDPVSLLPAPDMSEVPPAFVRAPVDLHFGAVPQAHAYRIQLATSDQFERIVFDATSTTPTLILPPLANAKYAMRVRAIDDSGLEGHDAQRMIELAIRADPPSALAPSEGEVFSASAPAFRWRSETSDQAPYHFQIARDAAFTQLQTDIADLREPSTALSAPLPSGVYHWRIAQGVDQRGLEVFSAPRSFRIVGSPPVLEAVTPMPTQLIARWQPLTASRRYHAQLARDEQFRNVIDELTVDRSEATFARPAPGHYYLRVSALEADGFEGPSRARQAIDLHPAPPAPHILQPANGHSASESPVEFRWQPHSFDVVYRFQLARERKFLSPLSDAPGVTQSKFDLHSQLDPGVYYWRVAAATPTDGEGPFSETRSFRVLPGAPLLTQIDVEGNHLTLYWREQPFAAQYEVQLAKDAQFQSTVVDERASTERLRAARPPAGDYYARIRAFDKDGVPGPYSEPRNVHVATRVPVWLLPLVPLLIFAL